MYDNIIGPHDRGHVGTSGPFNTGLLMARPKLCTKYKVYSFAAFETAEGMSNVLCHAHDIDL